MYYISRTIYFLGFLCEIAESRNKVFNVSKVYDTGFAYPLGMQSGKIKKSQLSSYPTATQESLTMARLFGPNGWRPDDVYLTRAFRMVVLGTSLSSMMNAPIFFQIKFERMKTLSYFIIQDSTSHSTVYSQSFYISYNDSEWKVYGDSNAKELECQRVFGNPERKCNHTFSPPFRANAVRVIAKDYEFTVKPKWRIEFGGLSYIEADHFWPMDKIMFRNGEASFEIPDERGKFILSTNFKIPGIDLPIATATGIEYANDLTLLAGRQIPTASFSATASSEKACYFNPSLCLIGLSISSWLQTQQRYGNLISTADNSEVGFKVDWSSNGRILITITSFSRQWNITYAVPECEGAILCTPSLRWLFWCAVWNRTDLKLFINGRLANVDTGVARNSLYKDNNILRMDSLLLTRDVRLWDYSLSEYDVIDIYNETIIDFTITAFDDFGDWQIGIGCTETKGTGPCADHATSETPGEGIGLLRHRGVFVDSAVYKNYKCFFPLQLDSLGRASGENPFNVALTMGFTVKIIDDFNYEQVESFKVHFKARSGSTSILNANIYAASSYNFDGRYQSMCGMRNFRRDVYYGPISWSTGSWESNTIYDTPDLMKILRPLFDRGTLPWRKYFFIIFEWISTPGSTVQIRLQDYLPYYTFQYRDNKPDKYLYADATLALHPGYPLIYKTKPIIPIKKCLSFWYHMYGKSIGILSVSLKQEPSIFKEVFRIHGEQGNRWKNAQVPITGLNVTSYQFQVIFTAIRGETTVGDIAIDTIKLTVNPCSFLPLQAVPKSFSADTLVRTMIELNISMPRLLLPFEEDNVYFADQGVSLLRNAMKRNLISDMFGFPLSDSYFNDSFIELQAKSTIQIDHDFTLSFHARPHEIKESVILWIGNKEFPWLTVGISSKGQLLISANDKSGVIEFKSRIFLGQFIWSYISIVHSRRHQTMTTYLNSTLQDSFTVATLTLSPTPVSIFIGGTNHRMFTNYFHGHISCVLFYDSAMDSHVIRAFQLCPNKHVASACSPRCQADGICDQIRRKCLCPTSASKYSSSDCSNGLRETLYNLSSTYVDFDSRQLLQNILGPGGYYKDVIAAEKDVLLNATGSYFTTVGQGNLALCTTSTDPIRMRPVESNCIVDGRCNINYSISFWVLLPSRTTLKNTGNFTIVRVGPLTMEVVRNAETRSENQTSLFSTYLHVTFSSTICEWELGKGVSKLGVWSHYVISVDISTMNIIVYQNGNVGTANRKRCIRQGISGDKVIFGGGTPMLCYDEFSIWEGNMDQIQAEKLYNAIAFSGYSQYAPRGIKFDRLSYSEKLESLWALSTEGRVYVYHPDQYWMKVAGKMESISAGQYGIWAVDNDGNLRFRMGINASSPGGTHWSTVNKASYGSKTVKRVSDGFSGTMFFTEKITFMLYCMKVTESGVVVRIGDTGISVSDVACSTDYCCGYKIDGRTYCFDTFTCGSERLDSLEQEAYSTNHVSSDRLGHLFRLSNGTLYRRRKYPVSWVKVPINQKYDLKSVLSLNGQPIVITKDGKLKMIGTGDDVMKIIHSGGYCLTYSGRKNNANDWHFRLKENCDLFKIVNFGCIQHLLSQRFFKPIRFKDGFYMALTDTCQGNDDAMGFKRENYSVISKLKLSMFLAPYQKIAFPSGIHGAFLYSHGTMPARVFEFYFPQASPFKRITGFYPRNVAKGTLKGEVVIAISVSFRFRDFEYIYNFRDSNGIEASSIFRKVETEMKQIFSESNSFSKSEYTEISFGEAVNFSCVMKGGCFKPFEVKFIGYLYFSYISSHERYILKSDKFNGVAMDCGNNECRFNLDPLYRKAYFTPPKITLVNKTDSSLLFQYQPLEIHGLHTGYQISFHGSSRSAARDTPHTRSFTLYDGLIFNISSLFPYFQYTITVTPLELQSMLYTARLVEHTLESYPNIGPSVILLNSSQSWCLFKVFAITDENWNGRPLGYRYFYAKESNLTKEQLQAFNINDDALYMTITENFTATTQKLFDKLEVYTKYIFYFGGITNAGIGSLTRKECTTKESSPDQFKQNFNISGINSTHIRISWLPCPDDNTFWNNGGNISRGYKIFLEELSIPKFGDENGTVFLTKHPSGEIFVGPIEEDRVYGIQIAAVNDKGEGQKSNKICFRVNEGVPNATTEVLYTIYNTSTSLNVTVGKVELRHENGKIVYYNISLLSNLTGGAEFHIARIDDMVNISANLNASVSLNKYRPKKCSMDISRLSGCSLTPILINGTSDVVNITISNLTYWTKYKIQASACTCVGCGPFSTAVYAKTDEHQPTCSTDEIKSVSTSSTSLNITWKPLQLNCTHGYLTGYRIFFGIAEAFARMTNFSEEWQVFNENDLQENYYVDTSMENILVDGLRKFSNYCVAISGGTVKGFGPASEPVCNLTLEDRPDGPPRKMTLRIGEKKTVEILMMIPEKDKCNGVILGYVVYFSERNHGHLPHKEYNKTVPRNDSIDGSTKATIEGLKAFMWYQFEAVAFTSGGEGNRTNQFIYILTLEDVPSGVPRNLTISNQTENSIKIEWLQVVAAKLNGVFRRFSMLISETLADGSQGIHREYLVIQNRTLDIKSNSTSIPTGTIHNLTDYSNNSTFAVEFDNTTRAFSLSYINLRPYTNYSISIAACTNPGCGNSSIISTRTEESYPAGSPGNFLAKYTAKASNLLLIWDELPILQRNGIIKGYNLKWMKFCHFLHLQNLTSNITDCKRVPKVNISNFQTKFVSSPFLEVVIGNLSSYTNYMIGVAAVTSAGVGPESKIIVFTDDDVPSKSPIVTSAFNTSGRSIQIEWINIALQHQNGILLGYRVFYHNTDQNNSISHEQNCSSSNYNITKCEIRHLDLYTNYTFAVGGYTRKGIGPLVDNFIVKTGPYLHGNWSLWGQWSSCSRSCGGGEKSRKRVCNNPAPWNGGDYCKGISSESTACNTRRCSGIFPSGFGQDCQTFCEQNGFICNPKFNLKDSAAGFRKAGLICKDEVTDSTWDESYHPAFVEDNGICAGFKSIPASVQCNATPPFNVKIRRLCNCFDRADIGFSDWAPWSYCSKSCGGGKQRSRRECSIPDSCIGNSMQTRDCNTRSCPVDGQWGPWSSMTKCNRTCEYGYQHRYRKCNSPAAAYGGEECYGPSVEYIRGCNPHLCPIHGGWSSWETDGTCNQACGGGYIVHYRYCDSPVPEFGGNYCKGSHNRTEPCNQHNCIGVQVLFWFVFTDFEWNYRYYSLTSALSVELSNKIKKNMFATYKYAPYVTGMRLINFRSKFPSKRSRRDTSVTHVVANIAVFYSESKRTEILYVQDYVKSNSKLFHLNVSTSTVEVVNVLSSPPQNLTGVAIDPHTIQVTWSPPNNVSQLENATNYYIFYRQKNGIIGQWESRGIPLTNNSSFNITRLKPRTWYKIRITVSVLDGNGPASEEISIQTLEGAPSEPPGNLILVAIQPTKLYVQWDHIDSYNFHGIPSGYIVKYKNYNEENYHEVRVPYEASDVTLVKLRPYTVYIVTVCGYTAVGNGPRANNIQKTLEGVPSEPPSGIKVQHKISLDSIIITWNALNEDRTNGRFRGYKVKYTTRKVAGVDVMISDSNRKEIIVDKYTLKLKISELVSYSSYDISVCGFTEAGNGPFSKPILAETCKCPENIFMNWYESRPYMIKDNNGTLNGIFKDIADGMIKTSCGACNGILPKINYIVAPTGESAEKISEVNVKARIQYGYHISFPIFGRAEMRHFMDDHIFLELVRSPGSAMIVNGAIDYTAKTINAFKSVINTWPMVLIIILISLLFGILIWTFEQFYNDEFARGRYILGMCQGFWWALVSMTTVGYGDITPRSIPGRIVAMIWTLIGLVLVGILTGALTSTVTTLTIPPTAKLYDTNTAVINNTFDHRLAIRRNAKVQQDMRFQTAEEVLLALHQKKVDVALLDAFVTAAQKFALIDKELKVKKVISANTAFGFVLSKEMVRLENDFKSHVSSNQDRVTQFISNMTNMLEISDDQPPDIKLLDPKTPAFWIVLKFELSALGVLAGLGIMWTLLKLFRKRIKVSQQLADEVIFVYSFEEMLKTFSEHMDERLESLTREHQNRLQDLMKLKANWQRRAKRSYYLELQSVNK